MTYVVKILNSPMWRLVNFEVFKALLRRIAEEVEAEIKRVEKELAEARRVGRGTEELAAVRDVLREDKWLRIATAVLTKLKKEFVEDGKAAEVVEAAERQLNGFRLEVLEAPLLRRTALRTRVVVGAVNVAAHMPTTDTTAETAPLRRPAVPAVARRGGR
jgi:hypothetical protein